MAYPTSPTNGQTIGRNLCPRPTFNDLTPGGWSGHSSMNFSSTYSRNRMLIAANGTAKITLPGVPVTPADFRITIDISNTNGAMSVGVRPVGSSRLNAPQMAKALVTPGYGFVGGPDVAPSRPLYDSILAGDTGTEVELYVHNDAAATGSVSFASIRVDYSDSKVPTSSATWYFDGATPDIAATVDYSWDGAAYNSTSSAKAIVAVVPDTTPPSKPTGLTVTGTTASTISLGWTAATDNVGVTGYNVYEGSTKLTPTPITTLTYTATGITPGTSYSYTVTALDAAGNESVKSAAANVDKTPPSTPTGLFVNNVGDTKVNIYWTPATDNVGVTAYRIYEDGVQIDTVPGSFPPTTYQRTGLTPNTSHAYTVTALDAAGNESAPSAVVSGTPPSPTNLRQTGATMNSVELSWDPSTHPTPVKYLVYEGLSLQNHKTPWPMDILSYDADTLEHSGVGPGGYAHLFSVSAVDEGGKESDKAPPIYLENDPRPNDATAEFLSCTAHTVDIKWAPAYDPPYPSDFGWPHGVVGYWVWAEPDQQPAYRVNATMLPPDTLSYTISGLADDSYYSIYVQSEDTIGQLSLRTAKFGFWTKPSGHNTPPTQPTGVRVVSVSETTAYLEWNLCFDPDNPDDRPTYRVLENGQIIYSTVGQGTGTAGRVEPWANITGLVGGSTHTVVVCSWDGLDFSEPSAPVTFTLLGGTPPPPDVPPTTPTGFVVTGITDTTISLAWDPSTDDIGVVGYHVYQDSIRITGTTPVAGTAYTATGLAIGRNYTFAVKAVDTKGQLSPSSVAVTATTTGTPPPPDELPSTPSGLIVTGITDTTVGLAWDASADDVGVTGYRVYRGGTAITGTIPDPTYVATGLTHGTQYSFTVKAVDTVGQLSAASAAVTATTTGVDPLPPSIAAPTGLHTAAVTNTTVDLAWDTVTDAVGYHVYRGGVKLTATPITEITYTATALTQGTTYSFTVKAVGSAGQLSPASNAVSTTTTGTPPTPTDPPPDTPTSAKLAVMEFLGTDDPRIMETL